MELKKKLEQFPPYDTIEYAKVRAYEFNEYKFIRSLFFEL